MAVPLSFFRSETSQRLRAEGRAEGQAQMILTFLGQRGVHLSGSARARLSGCRDLDLLDTWASRVLTVSATDELFAED